MADLRSLILDGEIVEWDPDLDCPVAFGTLKTAAIAVRDGTGQSKNQPLCKPCVYGVSCSAHGCSPSV